MRLLQVVTAACATTLASAKFLDDVPSCTRKCLQSTVSKAQCSSASDPVCVCTLDLYTGILNRSTDCFLKDNVCKSKGINWIDNQIRSACVNEKEKNKSKYKGKWVASKSDASAARHSSMQVLAAIAAIGMAALVL